MRTEYYKEYSNNLHRDMEFKVYGHAGRPVLVFPCQDGRFFDFEDRGMINLASPFIDEGKIQIFTCDSDDLRSWSAEGKNGRERIEAQEEFFRYITEELAPRIFDINKASNGGNYMGGIISAGCSMGASHAVIVLLRRPDLFSGCIAMSGAYNAGFAFKDYWDELVELNSPVHFLDKMSYDDPIAEQLRNRQIILCTGRGAWEVPMQEDTARMAELFNYKDIDAWCDFWGTDVCHDWPWWEKQWPYFLRHIIYE